MKKDLPSIIKSGKTTIGSLVENTQDFLSSELEVPLDQLMKFVETKNPFLNMPEEKKLIILVDIVGFSKNDSKTQVLNIYMFQKFIRGFVLSNKFIFGKKINITSFIPTGDGSYILAEKCDEKSALDFLLTMISGFQKISNTNGTKVSLRASALFGSCIPFIDLAHHKNYIGEGMNEASRVLSCGRASLENQYREQTHSLDDAKSFSKNSLFLDDTLAFQAAEYAENASNFMKFFDVADKHGKKRNITVLQGIKELE